MDKQKEIIAQLKNLYPKTSQKELAALVGLHPSRIQRILKGAPMKLKEWERFWKIVEKNPQAPINVKLQESFNNCLLHLTPKGKEKLLAKLQRLEHLARITLL